MASPQTGIFALGTSSHAYLEFDVRATSMAETAVRRVAGLREPRTTIGGVNVVAGFRPGLWASVAPTMSPPSVTDFATPIVGEDQKRLSAMLESMVGLGDGPRDDLTRFTTAESGAYYVVPSVEALAAFGEDDGSDVA